MKFQIEMTTIVEIPYNPRQYPAGMTPQEALSLQIEELSKDPRELTALDAHVSRVRGVTVHEESGVRHREPQKRRLSPTRCMADMPAVQLLGGDSVTFY